MASDACCRRGRRPRTRSLATRVWRCRVAADQAIRGEPRHGQTLCARRPPPEVIVSGWQIYDNKGRVVEKYEPFFSTGWDYAGPTDAQLGQKATMFYDPRGQLVRTVNPDGSEQRVVHGAPGRSRR